MTLEEAEKVTRAYQDVYRNQYLRDETEKQVEEARAQLSMLEERLAREDARLCEAKAVIEAGKFA